MSQPAEIIIRVGTTAENKIGLNDFLFEKVGQRKHWQ